MDTRESENQSSAERPTFIPPEHLTRSGLDALPEHQDPNRILADMNTTELIQAMLESAKKDMAKYFGMTLNDPVRSQVVFPWDKAADSRSKLSEVKKIQDSWIIEILSHLKEDMTYALFTANLADIWFDTIAHSDSLSLKTGFHFWIVYKLACQRKYVNVALAATRQNREQFERIRKIEESFGEYGVFYNVVKGKNPDYSRLSEDIFKIKERSPQEQQLAPPPAPQTHQIPQTPPTPQVPPDPPAPKPEKTRERPLSPLEALGIKTDRQKNPKQKKDEAANLFDAKRQKIIPSVLKIDMPKRSD